MANKCARGWVREQTILQATGEHRFVMWFRTVGHANRGKDTAVTRHRYIRVIFFFLQEKKRQVSKHESTKTYVPERDVLISLRRGSPSVRPCVRQEIIHPLKHKVSAVCISLWTSLLAGLVPYFFM